MAKAIKIRLVAPEGLQSTGIYGVDPGTNKTYEYPVGTVLEISDEFDYEAAWPGRVELVDGPKVKSKKLTADDAAGLAEQLAAVKADADTAKAAADVAAEQAKADAEAAAAEIKKLQAELAEAKKPKA